MLIHLDSDLWIASFVRYILIEWLLTYLQNIIFLSFLKISILSKTRHLMLYIDQWGTAAAVAQAVHQWSADPKVKSSILLSWTSQVIASATS